MGDNSQRLASLTSNGGGTTAINGGSVTTTGNQTYSDAVTLGVTSILSTGTGPGNLTFGGTLEAAAASVQLTLIADAGDISFRRRRRQYGPRTECVDDQQRRQRNLQ